MRARRTPTTRHATRHQAHPPAALYTSYVLLYMSQRRTKAFILPTELMDDRGGSRVSASFVAASRALPDNLVLQAASLYYKILFLFSHERFARKINLDFRGSISIPGARALTNRARSRTNSERSINWPPTRIATNARSATFYIIRHAAIT